MRLQTGYGLTSRKRPLLSLKNPWGGGGLPYKNDGGARRFFRGQSLSFEYRKTKTKVITLTNHNSRKQSNEPIRAPSKYMQPAPNAGKRVQASRDWFSFLLLIGRESGTRCFSQSQTVAMQNQSNCEITFDIQLKTALKSKMTIVRIIAVSFRVLSRKNVTELVPLRGKKIEPFEPRPANENFRRAPLSFLCLTRA